MNVKILKQYDSRWSADPYPKARVSTVGGCGCGLLACVHVAMEQESKKDWTPDNLRKWMVSKGFAVTGQGTKWEGITETLKHIGHTKVVRIYNDPMSEAWKELDKGNRIGVILFNNGRGHRFTSSGHYMAFTGYMVKNGEHYFYLKDSGGRGNSGWKSYSYCKGCISKMWIVERVGAQVKSPVIKATDYRPKTPYNGSLPKGIVKDGTKGDDAKKVQRFLNWCINSKLAVDGIAGDKTVDAIKTYQKTYGLAVDGIFGSASKKKAESIISKFPSKGKKIADNALKYAYSGEPKESKYPSGHAKPEYKEGLNKAFPKRPWGDAPKKGASCDVFVATCARNAGDKLYPRGLAEQEPYLKQHYTKISYDGDRSVLRDGDIGVMQYGNGSGGHTFVIIKRDGKIKICEANYKSTYGITVSDKDGVSWRLKHRTGKDYCHIFRAK